MMSHTPDTDAIPLPRKQPKQARSKALVEAVIESCLQILDSEGEAALTTQRISEVSGASIGSIYQYFPNKDAMVAAVYAQILDREAADVHSRRQQFATLPLPVLLREVLGNIIRVERRLFQLHAAFHLRYHSALHLGMWNGEHPSAMAFIEATWLPLLDMYQDEVRAPDPKLAAYLLGKGLRGMIRSVLEDVPEQLDSPALLDALVAMALGCLQPPQ